MELKDIIIGDGSTEFRILKALENKLDHSDVLLYSGRGVSIGLSAALDMLATLFSLDRRVTKYLLIIDKEHVKSVNDIEKGLRDRGFTVRDAKECFDDVCYVFIVERSGRRGVVAVSIQGRERSIEESIAELIKMRYNEDVGSDKKSLREWFKGKRLSVEKVMEQSGYKLVEKALAKALNTLKQMQIAEL